MLVFVRSARRLFLFLAALSLVAPSALAQGRDKGVFCSKHGNVGACDGTLDCDRRWAEHVRDFHRGDGGGLDHVAAISLSPKGTPVNVIARGLLWGGVGAMAGSFSMLNDSTSRAMAGALGAAGIFVSSGVISNRGAWGPVSSSVLGAAGGAGIGAGAGKMGEKSLEGTPEARKEKEHTTSLTTAGAVAGAVIGLAFPIISKQVNWPGADWFAPGGRVTMLGGSRRVGMSIAW